MCVCVYVCMRNTVDGSRLGSIPSAHTVTCVSAREARLSWALGTDEFAVDRSQGMPCKDTSELTPTFPSKFLSVLSISQVGSQSNSS